MMKFKAVMLDFDGTVTERGVYSPSPETVETLARVAQKIPIGFCTGRELKSFLKRGFSSIVHKIDEERRVKLLENLFLFAENGAFGYEFDNEKGCFEEFYRVDWPDEFICKHELKKQLIPRISEFGEFCENAHEIIAVFRTHLAYVEDRNADDIYSLSSKMYDICLDFLKEFDPDFEKHLHLGNSGIGVVIGPAEGDKDQAILKFSEILRDKRGMDFDDRASEILVIGDSPLPDGNDHYFLKGDFGTPYTVGPEVEGSKFPIPAVKDTGERLYNEKGTVHLLKKLILQE